VVGLADARLDFVAYSASRVLRSTARWGGRRTVLLLSRAARSD
jgi:hypothetical protein